MDQRVAALIKGIRKGLADFLAARVYQHCDFLRLRRREVEFRLQDVHHSGLPAFEIESLLEVDLNDLVSGDAPRHDAGAEHQHQAEGNFPVTQPAHGTNSVETSS